jgi:hypothetical protein
MHEIEKHFDFNLIGKCSIDGQNHEFDCIENEEFLSYRCYKC